MEGELPRLADGDGVDDDDEIASSDDLKSNSFQHLIANSSFPRNGEAPENKPDSPPWLTIHSV